MLLACVFVFASQIFAQSSAPAAPSQTQTPTPAAQKPEPATAPGKVLYQSHGDAPATPDQQNAQPAEAGKQAPANATPQLTDADRAAIHITRYELDIRIVPVASRLTGRARLTLRNASENPLPRIALQISSTLTWESASVQGTALPLAQHLLDTDADHTGRTRELILMLPKPLSPGENLTLDTFYSGTIAANGERLERLGARRLRRRFRPTGMGLLRRALHYAASGTCYGFRSLRRSSSCRMARWLQLSVANDWSTQLHL